MDHIFIIIITKRERLKEIVAEIKIKVVKIQLMNKTSKK